MTIRQGIVLLFSEGSHMVSTQEPSLYSSSWRIRLYFRHEQLAEIRLWNAMLANETPSMVLVKYLAGGLGDKGQLSHCLPFQPSRWVVKCAWVPRRLNEHTSTLIGVPTVDQCSEKRTVRVLNAPKNLEVLQKAVSKFVATVVIHSLCSFDG